MLRVLTAEIMLHPVTRISLFSVKILLQIMVLLLMTFFLYQSNGCENKKEKKQMISAADPRIQYIGRFDFSDPLLPSFAWTGSSIRFRFEGKGFGIFLKQLFDSQGEFNINYYYVIIDSTEFSLLKTTSDSTYYEIANNLTAGIHQVEIFRRTEASCGVAVFAGLKLSTDAKLLDPPPRPDRKIEFIGNSITCGFGNEAASEEIKFSPETEDGYRAYSAIAARKLDAEYHAICYSGRGVCRNYDQSTTGLMPELYRLIYPQSTKLWDFSSWVPDVVVINLGTNDFASGIPDSSKFILNYLSLLKQIKSCYPEANIICLDGPMLTDPALTACKAYIKSAVTQFLRQGYEKVYTFSLTTQGPLGMGADYHPNLVQHQLNAAELVQYMKTVLKW